MNINKNVFNNLLQDIKELSDVDLQKKIWLNIDNNTGTISSYDELYNKLFDDDLIELFYDNFKKNMGYEKTTIELEKLINLLNTYKEPDDYNGNDTCIINDPNWHIVIEQAKIVLGLLKN